MPVGFFRLYAHRGAMRTSPENTIEALSRARQEGVDGIEFDVRLSADGEPFLFHDDTASRVCGRDVRVSEIPWREVRTLQVFGKYPIAHLDEALKAVEDWPGAELFLDLHQPSLALAEITARHLEKTALRERAYILDSYKNRHLLLHAVKTSPGVKIAVMPGPPWRIRRSCDLGVAAISLGWAGERTRLLYRLICRFCDVRAGVKLALSRGIFVSGGVANTPEDIRYIVEQGIMGIWTDDLAMTRRVLEEISQSL